ncbi:MAG: PKD domain-containing protein [Promethearchaeota archaeon]
MLDEDKMKSKKKSIFVLILLIVVLGSISGNIGKTEFPSGEKDGFEVEADGTDFVDDLLDDAESINDFDTIKSANVIDMPNLLSAIEFENNTWSTFIDDNYIYIAQEDGIHIVDYHNASNPIIINSFSFGENAVNSIYVEDSLMYVGCQHSLEILNISDVLNIVHISSGPQIHYQGLAILKHGDIVYYGDYIDGLVVYNVSDPYNPDCINSNVSDLYDPIIQRDGAARRRIFFMEIKENALFIGTYNGIQVANISDPAHPIYLGDIVIPNPQWTFDGYGDCEIIGDLFYTVCFGNIRVLNISDPSNIQLVSNLYMGYSYFVRGIEIHDSTMFVSIYDYGYSIYVFEIVNELYFQFITRYVSDENSALGLHLKDGLLIFPQLRKGVELLDANLDSDGDSLTDYEEYYIFNSDIYSNDSDSDGMPDYWEATFSLNLTLDDTNLDFDGDSLTNLEEFQIGTEPNNNDTDSDLLSDYWEVENGLNPCSNDTDGDQLSDYWEIENGLNPANSDTDFDLLPDNWEVMYGFNAIDYDDSDFDGDMDMLPNIDEFYFGTDPTDFDTDDDGYSDGEEFLRDSDPLDVSSPLPDCLSSGDKTYIEGVSGNNITWILSDPLINISWYGIYFRDTIHLDNTIYYEYTKVEEGVWASDVPLVYFVNELSCGSYEYNFLANDGYGENIQSYVEITIIEDLFPVASIESRPDGDGFRFTADVEGGNFPLTFQWDFGDNSSIGTEQYVSHDYQQDGNYTITLTVTDANGDQDSCSVNLEITSITSGSFNILIFSSFIVIIAGVLSVSFYLKKHY